MRVCAWSELWSATEKAPTTVWRSAKRYQILKNSTEVSVRREEESAYNRPTTLIQDGNQMSKEKNCVEVVNELAEVSC